MDDPIETLLLIAADVLGVFVGLFIVGAFAYAWGV